MQDNYTALIMTLCIECQKRLRRTLREAEKIFITSRRGFIALEAIEDTIKSLAGKELENYLNSGSKK